MVEIEDLENNTKKKLVIATANPHKLEEINEINSFSDIEFTVVKGDFNPIESGDTFEENAYIKANAAAQLMETYCLADDSGLCVDALDGAPGLHSARYAGTQEEKIQKLIKNLEEITPEKRTAHFISVMVLVDSKGTVLHTTEGIVNGTIIDSPKGTNGFGYDPIFYIKEHNQTMAEMNSVQKNLISHRAKALNSMLSWIHENL